LQEIATILDENVRTSDIAARWGGEEFAVMLFHTTAKAALKVAEKLRQQIEISSKLHSYVAEGVSASLGVTIMSAEEPLDQVMHRADRALYQSKKKGKNQVVLI
jgi:diguanylate cyclase (GGDEF)-like protein